MVIWLLISSFKRLIDLSCWPIYSYFSYYLEMIKMTKKWRIICPIALNPNWTTISACQNPLKLLSLRSIVLLEFTLHEFTLVILYMCYALHFGLHHPCLSFCLSQQVPICNHVTPWSITLFHIKWACPFPSCTGPDNLPCQPMCWFISPT